MSRCQAPGHGRSRPVVAVAPLAVPRWGGIRRVRVPGTGPCPVRRSPQGRSTGELPGFLADERDLGSVGEYRVHVELRSADHEVDVDLRGVHPLVRLSVERIRDAESVGDVTGGVLVEQRAVEEVARLADTRLLRDERELAEP